MKNNYQVLDPILSSSNVSDPEMSDQFYIINLCNQLLIGDGQNESSLGWVLGDLNNNGKVSEILPLAVFYEAKDLVVECVVNQTKPNVDNIEALISGDFNTINNYNNKRKLMLEKKGVNLVTIEHTMLDCDENNNLCRDQYKDTIQLKAILSKYI